MTSHLTEQAHLFALKAHEGQSRKYTGDPYIIHPVEVALLVAKHGGSDEEISAGYLHDVVEDCNVSFIQLSSAFGKEVARLVEEVTDVSTPRDGNRRIRKEIDRSHIRAASPGGKTIKLADMISNTRSIAALDPDFARVYMHEKKALMEVLVGGNETLYKMAMGLIDDARTLLRA